MTQDNLPQGLSRRQFFRRFLGQEAETRDPGNPPPQTLETISDEKLRQLIPNLTRNRQYSIQGNHLMVRNQAGKSECLCELDAHDRFIMRQFDGAHSLGAIADQLGQIFGLEPDQPFQKVKGLFLLLSRHQLCETTPA